MRPTEGLDQHARGMGRDGLHVLDLDVLGAPVVQHQAEYPPADHAADRRRLEIAAPDLAAIRRGACLEADVERFEAGPPLGIQKSTSAALHDGSPDGPDEGSQGWERRKPISIQVYRTRDAIRYPKRASRNPAIMGIP